MLECIQRAEGNPLFLVQLLRDTGGAATVPGSIRSLVLSRVDRLAPADRDAVQAASVIGQRFGLPLLRHLVGVNRTTAATRSSSTSSCGPKATSTSSRTH